ncbi:YihY/virulence factor BrkB family protein [Saccharopolyspora erythraea]|uniref:YihY/virulence factor BrkB family protein n=1 Tax=Saccharopolyspora erythraea TaxID=1836 RepID=UPI002011EA56|nr:YihY/virulence factor BrkB family protein [Saccharopolyspora erythraea]
MRDAQLRRTVMWRLGRWRAQVERTGVARLAIGVVRTSARHRITGLAGEAAFFAVLSLPPLLLGLVGTIGYLGDVIGRDTVASVHGAILVASAAVLSPQGVAEIVEPTLDQVLTTGQAGISVVGFAVAVWSGSRALGVYIDTISVLYGLSGYRGLVRQRLMSVLLYTVGLLVGIALLPLMVVGPNVLMHLLPGMDALVHGLYWPAVLVLSAAFLSTLYYMSVPVHTPWRENLPGAAAALLVWIAGSAVLRAYLAVTIQSSPFYGALSAPIAVLLWLYVTALAILIGAAINAELDRLNPARTTARTRAEAEARGDAGQPAAAGPG